MTTFGWCRWVSQMHCLSHSQVLVLGHYPLQHSESCWNWWQQAASFVVLLKKLFSYSYFSSSSYQIFYLLSLFWRWSRDGSSRLVWQGSIASICWETSGEQSHSTSASWAHSCQLQPLELLISVQIVSADPGPTAIKFCLKTAHSAISICYAACNRPFLHWKHDPCEKICLCLYKARDTSLDSFPTY